MKRFAAVMLMIVLCMGIMQPLYVNAQVHNSRMLDRMSWNMLDVLKSSF